MAFITQEMKKKLSPAIKAVMKKYNMKGSISTQNHSTIIVKIKEGPIDFERDNFQIHNAYNNGYEGVAKKFIQEIFTAMKGDQWYDNSDSMIDYFDTAYYMRVYVGDYFKPYKVV